MRFVVTAAIVLLLGGSAWASTIKFSFEGLCDNEAIGSYYSGGTLSCSGRGPNYGVVFDGAVAKLRSDAGGTGNFSGEPSPSTAAFGSSIVTINIPGGFVSDFSFFYSNPYSSTTVRVFDGIDQKGNMLVQSNLQATPQTDPTKFDSFVAETLGFSGVAHSIGITSRGANGVYLDDVVFTSAGPVVIPEPGSVGMILCAAAYALANRLRTK